MQSKRVLAYQQIPTLKSREEVISDKVAGVYVPTDWQFGTAIPGETGLRYVALNGETQAFRDGKRYLKLPVILPVESRPAVLAKLLAYLKSCTEDSPDTCSYSMVITGGHSIPEAMLREHTKRIVGKFGLNHFYQYSEDPRLYWADQRNMFLAKKEIKEESAPAGKEMSFDKRLQEVMVRKMLGDTKPQVKRPTTGGQRRTLSQKISSATGRSGALSGTVTVATCKQILKEGELYDYTFDGRKLLWERHLPTAAAAAPAPGGGPKPQLMGVVDRVKDTSESFEG
jgi:hypothetical protein